MEKINLNNLPETKEEERETSPGTPPPSMYLFEDINNDKLWKKIHQRYVQSNKRLEKQLLSIIKARLADDSWSVRQSAVKMIQYAPENERTNLIKIGLADDSCPVRQSAAEMIQHAPESEREELQKLLPAIIKIGLADNNSYVRRSAANMIQYAPESEREELEKLLPAIIRTGLTDDSWYVRQSAVKMIQYAPENERTNLIKTGLADNRWSVCRSAVQMIQYALENERTNLIKIGLADNDSDIRRLAVQIIQYVPEDERTNLIKTGLADDDNYVRQLAANMIQYAPESERKELEKLLPAIIRTGLATDDSDVRRLAAEMIQYAPENERTNLIKAGLADDDWSVRRSAVNMIQYAPESEREEIRTIEIPKEEAQPVSTPLYKNVPKKFFKEDFSKSGTKTTLLGEWGERSLRGKAIIRHYPLQNYLTWKKAFEDYQFWQDQGFDYVPIEPILTVMAKKDSYIVDVYTQVLGPSVADWQEENPEHFWLHIEKQKNKIIKGLEELGIEHGHIHDGNFCLVFPKKQDGTDDYTKLPRVYAIDFDMSKSK